MEYRHLGNSGLEVSVLGLGGNMFGSYVDEAQTKTILHRAIDLGINFFDNAKTYAGGASEELMGKALEGRRHEVLIATKAGSRSDVLPNNRGASLKHLTAALDQSLRKLRTDYVDLFQVHFPDANTPVEETMYALDTMLRQGKARYVGCSNHDAWQICEANWTAKANGWAQFVSVQSEYNVLNRELESDVIPFCRRYGVGVIPYYPLAAGFLTGKYRPGEPPPEDSRGAHSRYWSQWPTERNYGLVASLKEFAEKRGHTPIELALVWLAGRPAVSTIIAGTSKPEQVESNVKALEWELTEEDLAELDNILSED